MKKIVNADTVTVVRVGDLDAATLRAAHALAHAAFGDDEAFLARLTAAAADERYLYIRESGGIAAGCFLLGATLYTGADAAADADTGAVAQAKRLHGGYLYALCTAAAYRRRGFAHALIGAAAREAGDFLVTVPASRSLCDFYRRLGFTRALSGCVAVGGIGESAAPAETRPGGYADAVRAAQRHGGLLLSEGMFDLSLAESGAAPCVAGDAFCAVRGGRLYGAVGLAPGHPMSEKALLRSKVPLDLDGIYADLLIEV